MTRYDTIRHPLWMILFLVIVREMNVEESVGKEKADGIKVSRLGMQ